MNSSLIFSLIEEPTDEVIDQLFDDSSSFFWVDWRADDAEIAEACESVLKTGQLRAEWQDEELILYYGGKDLVVPLTYSPDDRHVTLLTLNELLAPDYEIRLAWDSNGSDTLALLPLTCDEWRQLESSYGKDKVAAAFLQLTSRPNIFTDPLKRPKSRPWWRFW